MNFLNQFPLDFTNPQLRRLLALLINAYPQPIQAQHLAGLAGMAPGKFPLHNNMQLIWREVIVEMSRQGKLSTLVEQAAADVTLRTEYRDEFAAMLTVPPPPPPAVNPLNKPFDIDGWVEVLEQCQSMQDPRSFLAVISELPADIRNNVDVLLPTLRAKLRNLVRTCTNYEQGLAALVDAVRTFEGETLVVQKLSALLRG